MTDVGVQELPSVALDRLFLQLHEQLPTDARGKLAQLADEVKRLTESNIAQAPVTPPSSADQAVAGREIEIATTEAKKSSVELQAQGAVVTALSDQPTLRDVVCFAVPRVAPKWYDLGLALDVKPFVLDTISQEQKCPDQPRTMLVKWLEGSPGTGSQHRTWQSVLDAVGMICGSAAMEDIRAAVQTPRIPTAGDLEESRTTQHSSEIELSRKRRRSSTRSSDDLALQQSVAKKCLHDYTELKMDLSAQDITDLRSESDPCSIIRLLYSNLLIPIAKLLTPHLPDVKIAADNYYQLGLHLETVAEGAIASAESVDTLFSLMSVKRMWDNTRFIRKVVAAIPTSAPERQAAESILLHYNTHLAIFNRATLLKDALAKETKIDEKKMGSTEDDKLIPLKITSAKPIGGFTSEDCYRIQAQLLSTAYGIPQEKIACQDADERRSTTVTFVIPSQYMQDIVQCSMRLPTVWVLLELDIIEVSIPGVFTFIPSVGCFLSLLKGSKTFTADLLRVTEVLPYQTYCFLDPDTKEPLSGRPLSTKRIEQHWDSHGDLVPDPQCSVLESGDIDILATNDTTTQEQSLSRTRESQLEERIKVLEEAKSVLEAEVEKLQTQMKQLKILPSEQLAKQLAAKETECKQKDKSNREKDEMIKEKSATIRAQQAEIQCLRDQLVVFQKVRRPLRDWKKLGKCQKVIQHTPEGGWYNSVAVNSEGLLAVIDNWNRCIHLLRRDDALVRSIGKGVLGDDLGRIAFDLKGNIWVADVGNNKVLKLSQDGQLLLTIDHAGSKSDYFNHPDGVSVSPEGLIYICDCDNYRVTVNDEDGMFLFAFGSKGSGPGCFDAVCDVTFGSDGLVYVIDEENSRVCVWSKEGSFQRDFTTKYAPSYIAATGDNHLLISSWDSDTVMVYTLGGQLVHEFGGNGSDQGRFITPHGICVDDSGAVYVADYGNNRVQAF